MRTVTVRRIGGSPDYEQMKIVLRAYASATYTRAEHMVSTLIAGRDIQVIRLSDRRATIIALKLARAGAMVLVEYRSIPEPWIK